MNRSETYGGRQMDRTRAAKDTETMVGNGIATLLAVGAGALALLGLLTGFDVIDVVNPFETGLLWIGSSIPVGLAANVFRREHHILDEDEVRSFGTSGGTTTREDVGARRVDR
jgi:hypothetical protein